MGKGTTVMLRPADMTFLDRRGAISQRGTGVFSRSAVLHRELRLLRAFLERSDPRRPGGLAEEVCELVASLLPEPWLIKAEAIEHLALRLQEAAELADRARMVGWSVEKVIEAVGGLSFGEKAWLLDQALLRRGPAAARAGGERDEPD